MKLDPLDEILADIRNGRPIVLVDDVDRENEGDLMVAAEKVTAEALAFMLEHGKGLICISLPQSRLEELEIPLQPLENTSTFGTNFAVSFDYREVLPHGITAAGRAASIRHAADPAARPQDFVLPGFVFPVGAVPGGVLKRRGQTEGSVDLAALAGLQPAGVICEIMGADGRMLRGAELMDYCRKHQLKLTSVEALVQHRLHQEVSIRRVAEVEVQPEMKLGHSRIVEPLLQQAAAMGQVPTIGLRIFLYVDDVDGTEHLALVKGTPGPGCLVRIHSECLTGDVFQSARCDCGQQLSDSLSAIVQAGAGVVIYLHQEGRGIGLGNKLRAYELQDQGLDTVDANVHLGFEADERDYRVGAQILHDLGLTSVRLITNNPLKLEALAGFDIEVVERIALPVHIDQHNEAYMQTKRKRMGHLFS
ncbi:MAG: GTP cyclohydrolase II [Bdellovibrionales bacterium]|nr:GTP cyclohydrolase II [Bdellovibrionales bacterium]